MSGTKAGKRPLRCLTAHEKLNAIKRVSVGGESKASVARDIGVPESTLRGWCKNQEKISYQVRTSPPSVEDGPENLNILPAKRLKLDEQPYNLSMRTSDGSSGAYSPHSETNLEADYPKSSEPESDGSPLNLRTTKTAEPLPITTTPKVTNNNISPVEKERHDKECEKNKAELSKLSAALGLNSPEFISGLKNSSMPINICAALAQYRNLATQNWCIEQQALYRQNKTGRVPSPTDASTRIPATNGLLTTVDKRDKMLSGVDQQSSVYDSMFYWLRQQAMLGQSMATWPTTSTITSGANNTAPIVSNASNDLSSNQNVNQQMNLWNWYQQTAYGAAQMPPATPMPSKQSPQLQDGSNNQQILYQQLTKDPNEKEANCENMTKDEKPKNHNKNRSVLDNLLLNNNTSESKNEEEGSLTAHEAIEHGEKFLHWLEHCSDPSVTTLQLHTVQSLIKNLKSGFDRKSSDFQNRNKVRRK